MQNYRNVSAEQYKNQIYTKQNKKHMMNEINRCKVITQ